MSIAMDKLEAVAVIGSLEASVERCRTAIQTLKQSDIQDQQLLTMFRYSKVQPQAFIHLQRSGEYEGTSLLNELHEEYELCIKRMNWMNQMLTWIDQIAGEQNTHPIIIKGAAVNKWYPKGQIRFSKDVDVLLPNARELWMLTAQLRVNECVQKEAWYFSKRNDKQEPYFITGHWKKRFADGDFRLDLHAGFYSTFFLQKLEINVDEAYMPVHGMKYLRQLRPEMSLILLLGHALSHQGLTIRDINDAYCIYKNFPDIDMDMLRHYIRLNALEFVANDLEYWLKRIYVEDNHFRFWNKGVESPSTPAAQWPIHYNWRKISRQWWNLERIKASRVRSLREVVVLGWGNFFAKHLASMQTREWNRPTKYALQKISSFRHANVEFGYMSCPALLDDLEVPYHLAVEDKRLLSALQHAGVSAVWSDSLHGIRVSFEEGDLLLTHCGLFIISCNLLFTEEMIDRSQEILQMIRQFRLV
ncbi:nucleotidyltransferase family protein [Paenibacillus tyrfis]|uniref:nucleotidyltransferase family protein n=1 Tax=Paenibacillus tyrfis TaxID=1501230 RepID=UPI00209DBAC4|nr:nucleotidyltransferase family protein [Paenibacillus tyrfis]MCP1311575.1 nucleotidyltransferase family protein [Paenibacillus tyrfis]